MSGNDRGPSPRSGAVARVWLWRLAVAALLAAVVGVYFWSLHHRLHFAGEDGGYYSLQVHGWRKGTLAMDATPHPDLRVEYPNRITRHAPFLLDACYYQGKYYLYFGPAPALVLLLPYHLATGYDFPESGAAAVFATAGFLLSATWLGVLVRTILPGQRGFRVLAVLLALGLANLAPVALARAMFYELAVCAGYAFGQAALLAATLALLRPAAAGRWLALASLAAGFAAGSRPNLIVGAAWLLPLAALGAWSLGERSRARLAGLLLAGGLPVALCGSALLAYNYVRFDRWLEFGVNLQLGANPQGFGFSLRHLWHNLQVYYLSPPHLDWYFPFVAPGSEPARPDGYYGLEEINGQFGLMPLGILAAALLAWCWRRPPLADRRLRLILAGVAGWGLLNFLVVASAGVRASRYMMDFQPAFLLVLAVAVLVAAAARARAVRLLSALGAAGLAVLAAYNLLVGFRIYSAFQQLDPVAYASFEDRVHRAVGPVLAPFRPELGGLTYHVTFPAGREVGMEPLLVAGSPGFFDTLQVEYRGPLRARLLFSHSPFAPVPGPDFSYTPGQTAELRVQLGTFVPPLGHPWHEPGLSPEHQLQARHAALVTLDGRTVLDTGIVSYASLPRAAGTGRRWFAPLAAPVFSGRLIPAPSTPAPAQPGNHPGNQGEIDLILPVGRTGLREPLVTFGNPRAGRGGDALFLEYVGASTLRFGVDSAGHVAFSPTIRVEYAKPHTVAFEWQPSAIDRGQPGAVRLRFDGEEVWSAPLWSRDVPHGAFLPLANPGNCGSCQPYFTGTVLAHRRGAVPPAAANQDFPAVTLLRDGVAPAGPQPLATWMRLDGAAAMLFLEQLDPGHCRVTWSHGTDSVSATLPGRKGRAFSFRLTPTPNGFTLFERGAPVLRHSTGFYAPAGIAGWFGGEISAHHLQSREFGGTIRLGAPPQEDGTPAEGPLLLQARFPRGQTGRREPLVVAGITGAADAVYVRYVDEAHVVFGFDHWGVREPVESPPFALDYDREHAIWIDFDALHADGGEHTGQLRLQVAGHPRWTAPVACFPQVEYTLVVGRNPIGLSTCDPRFTGQISSVRQSPEPPPAF